MLAEISAGLSSLKAISDIVQGLNAANIQLSINDIKIGLQDHILKAQQALFTAQQAQTESSQKIGELEQEIMRLKNWEAEKQRYELKPLRDGDYAPTAYAVKESMTNGEPAHWICANCYQKGVKSILQAETRFPGRALVFVCHECDSELYAHGVARADQGRPRPRQR